MNLPALSLLLLPLSALGQMPVDPWLEALRSERMSAWIEQSGPRPGLTRAVVMAHNPKLELGAAASIMGLQAWSLATVNAGPILNKTTKDPAANSLRLSAGLGWNQNRIEVLGRATWGTWTLATEALSGRTALSWRQLQTSGWTLAAQMQQSLASKHTEWIIGLERPKLALYASSAGRWRAVFQRGPLRIIVGGGSTQHSSIAYCPF